METWQMITVLEKTESILQEGTLLEQLRALQVAEAALERYRHQCLATIEHDAASALARSA